MFASVNIIGDGTPRTNPYRPDVAGLVDQWQAIITTDKDGHPLYTDCLVSVPDWKPTSKIARFAVSPQGAAALLAAREPKITLDSIKEVPPGLDVRASLSPFELGRDDFNRADNADLGASWDVYNNSLSLVSNKIRVSATFSVDCNEAISTVLPANQWAQISVSTWPVNADVRYCWVMLRGVTPTTQTYYQYTIARNDGSFTSQLSKKISGVETSISSENSTSWAAGDVLRGSVYDSTLRLYRNGTQLLSGTDSAITSSLRAGCGAYVGVVTPADTVEMDSFVCGGFGPLASVGRGMMIGARQCFC